MPVVRMPVVRVRLVNVGMNQWWMHVGVRVWTRALPRNVVYMLMMLVVLMRMDVFLPLVRMKMAVLFADVQPNADGHQQARGNQGHRNHLP